MVVLKMHIEVEQRLQEVASFRTRRFFKEEIDVALNKAMDQVLRDSAAKFQQDQTELEVIAPLLEHNLIRTPYIPQTSDADYEPNTVFTFLPAGAYQVINSRVNVIQDKYNCSTAPTINVTPELEYSTKLTFPFSSSPLSQYYTGFRISRQPSNTTIVTVSSELPPTLLEPEQRFEVIDDIKDQINPLFNGTYDIFWEDNYRVPFGRGAIFVVTKASSEDLRLQFFAPDGITPNQTVDATPTTLTYQKYSQAEIDALEPADIVSKITPVNILEQDVVYQHLHYNKLTTTLPHRVLATQTKKKVIFYTAESFIITKIWLDYIRKPRRISLILNQSCELGESSHGRVVDLAVEYLTLDLQKQQAAPLVEHNELRNPIK